MDAMTMQRQTVHAVLDTPTGPVTVVGSGGALVRVLLEGTRAPRPGERRDLGPRDDEALSDAMGQLEEYFAGRRTAFDLELAPVGSAFQRLVWDGLRRIPFGETRSYGEVAVDIGLDPRTASRAVGAANGANPLAVVVPCHRVIGADGSLVGFAAGVERKRWLLEHEARVAGTRLF
jgi:methylated-DNA-[protein]-cysteine S-methyltransferase